MNDLTNSNAVSGRDGHCWWWCCCCRSSSSGKTPNPIIPPQALWVLIFLFVVGFGFSTFILVVVHNAAFFISFLFLSTLVLSFLLCNSLLRRRALRLFFHSLPDSDLRLARHGQLVKITGLISCGSVSLESSYEKISRCIYTSTLLYEYRGFNTRPTNVANSCFQWNITYSERFSTDFFITDKKSGIRALVKAGSGCQVIPLIPESRLIETRKCRNLSSHLTKWLRGRNLSADARMLRLEEGYIEEGGSATVFGMLLKDDDILMIVQPPTVLSTGCIWWKLLLAVDIDGLLLGVPERADPVTTSNYVQQQQQAETAAERGR